MDGNLVRGQERRGVQAQGEEGMLVRIGGHESKSPLHRMTARRHLTHLRRK